MRIEIDFHSGVRLMMLTYSAQPLCPGIQFTVDRFGKVKQADEQKTCAKWRC